MRDITLRAQKGGGADSISAPTRVILAKMSNRGRATFRRGGSLGLLSGRLRGGLVASSLPGAGSSCNGHQDSSASSSGSTIITASGSVEDPTYSGDFNGGLSSIMTMLRSINNTTTSLERRLCAIEEQQSKLSESMKAIIRKQDKESFYIKGSSLEVGAHVFAPSNSYYYNNSP